MSRAREFAGLAGSADAGGITGKNLIINGAMQVAQRGSVTGVTVGYGGPDRYKFARDGAAAVTLSQDTTVPSNQGFTSSLNLISDAFNLASDLIVPLISNPYSPCTFLPTVQPPSTITLFIGAILFSI